MQSVHKEIGESTGYDDLEKLARNSVCDSIIDVNDGVFAAPDSMTGVIRDFCLKKYSGGAGSIGNAGNTGNTGNAGHQAVPQNLGDFARCIFRSLAASYADTIGNLQKLTGTVYKSINIIGGGSQNEYLNQLTVESCGLPVYAGPAEGTALGNIISQMIALGTLSDVNAARQLIQQSFDVKEYKL